MERKELTINGTNYEFFLDARDTAHGFKHVCELHINGFCEQVATAQYYNRTWECYRFQSVMLNAIAQEATAQRETLKADFMFANGYQRLTEKRLKEFASYCEKDSYYKELQEAYTAVASDYKAHGLNC